MNGPEEFRADHKQTRALESPKGEEPSVSTAKFYSVGGWGLSREEAMHPTTQMGSDMTELS